MKKLFKLAVSLLICGLMLLSGCSNASTSLPSELTGQTGDYPKSVNIYAPDFFTNVSAEIAENTKKLWLEEMSQRYGVKFNIISEYYQENTDSSASSKETEEQTEDAALGLVSVSTEYISTIKVRIVNEVYMPLEGYLENNAVWNALPDDFKSLFEINGHIYAIPTSVSRIQSARIIHNEALKSTGGTVTDLDSFRDFSLAYEKVTGTAASKGMYFSDVRDILNAFGLYPGIDIGTPFTYDPTEDCYVDFMTKGTTVEALEYLRGLYNAGALYGGMDANLSKINATFDSGIFASAYDQYYDYEDCTEVLTMNSEYPQALFTNISGFAMTQNTPQPQETINLLVDMLFGSEQNYLQCWLGSSDNYTLNSDGMIIIEMAQDSAGNYVTLGMPNLAGELSDIFPYSNADLLYSKNGVVTTKSKTNAEKYKARLKLLEDSLENGSVVEIPPEYLIISSVTYDADLSDDTKPSDVPSIDSMCWQYFYMAIMNRKRAVQQIVDEYREKMLNRSGNMMLDEMNAAIGKKTAYYYG